MKSGLIPVLLLIILPLAIGCWFIPKPDEPKFETELVVIDEIGTALCMVASGSFGIAFVKLRGSVVMAFRLAAYICLLAAILAIAWEAYEMLNDWPLFLVKVPLTGR